VLLLKRPEGRIGRDLLELGIEQFHLELRADRAVSLRPTREHDCLVRERVLLEERQEVGLLGGLPATPPGIEDERRGDEARFRLQADEVAHLRLQQDDRRDLVGRLGELQVVPVDRDGVVDVLLVLEQLPDERQDDVTLELVARCNRQRNRGFHGFPSLSRNTVILTQIFGLP